MKKFVKTASQGFTKPAKLSSQGIIKAASHTFLELTQKNFCTLDPCNLFVNQHGVFDKVS
jgi:hypothetical protein